MKTVRYSNEADLTDLIGNCQCTSYCSRMQVESRNLLRGDELDGLRFSAFETLGREQLTNCHNQLLVKSVTATLSLQMLSHFPRNSSSREPLLAGIDNTKRL